MDGRGWMAKEPSDPSHVPSQQQATLDLLCLLDAQELSDHSPQLSRLFVIAMELCWITPC